MIKMLWWLFIGWWWIPINLIFHIGRNISKFSVPVEYTMKGIPESITFQRRQALTVSQIKVKENGKPLWENYYKPAFDEMVISLNPSVSGIYMITNNFTGQKYIGQAKSIKKRWYQHIRSGMGADRISSDNIMYQDMINIGPENFTYTILESCPEKILNEREKYWINKYGTYNNGYNKTKGNK